MAPIPNPTVIFDKIPKDYPVPGEHILYQPDSETIDLESEPLNGGILVKTLYISLDPYMRGRMRSPEVKSYSPPFPLHQALNGGGVGIVVRSESSKFAKGDHVTSNAFPWKAYAVLKEEGTTKIENPAKLPWSAFLGVSGMPALTAWYSTRRFANWKEGETIFVSTAAGTVGSVVCQLAKLAGLKVIGSTGDDSKLDFLKEIGVDVAFNYKKTDAREILQREGGIDVYFDNVGGPTLDAALEHIHTFGRVIQCGYASEYNRGDKEPYGIKNMMNVLTRSVTINGFIVSNIIDDGLESFKKEYAPLVAQGKIKFQEDKTHGLEKAGEGLVNLLQGKNQGKAILVVSEQE